MLHKSFAGLLLSIILFSCNKGEQVDLSTLQTYHNVAIPLISAEIDVEDMLQGDTGNIISTGNNGELFLAYVTEPTSIVASEIVSGEYSKGTFRIYLTRTASRSQILFSKLITKNKKKEIKMYINKYLDKNPKAENIPNKIQSLFLFLLIPCQKK